MGLLLRGGTLITASDTIAADLLVEGERIALIGAGIDPANHEVVDCAGQLILPGGIDVHTHFDLPLVATASNDDYFSGGRAAAFGGTTTHLDFVSQPKGGSLADGLALWRRKAEIAAIDYGFHITLTDPRPEVLAELPSMLEAGVPTIKLLMAYKGTFQIDDTALFQTLRIAREHGMLVMVHCENGDVEYLLRQSLRADGRLAARYHADSRPAEIEAEATGRAIALAGLVGCPLYVVHMTCAGAIDALRRGRAAGYPVMGETCVQYFHLTADHLARPDGLKYVCSPPIRTEADHAVLWRAIADGTLQAVSTDHCDFWYEGGVGPWREWAQTHDNNAWTAYEAQDPAYRRPGKELGRDDFSLAPNGLPGVEDRLMVMWELGVNGGRITPQQFVALTSTNPAKIFGLYPRKGALIPGADADLVIWDPARTHTIQAATHHMRTDYNCYEGLTVRGVPRRVYLRGRLIVDGDQWLGAAGAGQYLARGPHAPVL